MQKMFSLFSRLVMQGVSKETPPELTKKIKLLNRIAIANGLVSLLHAFSFIVSGLNDLIFTSLLITLISFGCIFLNKIGYFKLSRDIFIVVHNGMLLVYYAYLGKSIGIHYLFFPNVAFPFLLYFDNERWRQSFGFVLPVILMILCFFTDVFTPFILALTDFQWGLAELILSPTLAFLITNFLYQFYRESKELETDLLNQNEKYEQVNHRLKEREAELILNEKRFRSLIEHGFDGIALFNASGIVTYISPSIEQILGYKPHEIMGRSGLDFAPEDQREMILEMFDVVMKNPLKKFQQNYLIRQSNGNLIWFEASLKNMLGEEGIDGIIFNFRDIDKKLKAEQELQLSQSNLKALIENTQDFIWMVDTQIKLVEINTVFQNSYENVFAVRLTKGMSPLELLPAELKVFWEQKYRRALSGRMVYFDINEMVEGQPRYFEVRMHPVRTQSGDISGVSIFSRDISDRIINELKIRELNETLEEKVIERTKELEDANTELEAFNYTVSHDLRMPLRAATIFSGLLKMTYADSLDEEGKGFIMSLDRCLKEMEQLITDIMSYSKIGRQEINKEYFSMEGLVNQVISDVSSTTDVTREINFQVDELTDVASDESMMKNVWMNLIGNAVKYSGKTEKPIIEIGSIVEEDEVIYHIKDNGIGFDMKYIDSVFKVFERLHSMEEFEGTGVGLAIVKRIINKHGGRVWAEAEPNKGASFYFTLPVD